MAKEYVALNPLMWSCSQAVNLVGCLTHDIKPNGSPMGNMPAIQGLTVLPGMVHSQGNYTYCQHATRANC